MAYMNFENDQLRANRLPSSRHQSLNGFAFLDSPTFASEQDVQAKPSQAALDAHRTAQYILTQKDRPIPTLEQMREELKPDTRETLTKRIADLKEQHLSDLQRMYAWHSEEYLDDALNMYLSLDDFLYPPNNEDGHTIEEHHNDILKFYEESRMYRPEQMRWDNELERLRYSHLQLLIPLYQEMKQLGAREEEERKRREADFPISIADFQSKSKDVQLRVGRFLQTMEPSRQERMLSEYGWAARQVKPLQEVYKKDDKFKTDIVLLMMEVKDPRLR